jgi:two-component system nitrogen regulation sensor histidine kinase NtrY
MKHAFEPYVTTKAKGTGLGLAIVKKIIDEHGGRVLLENAPGGGACIRLVFPASGARRRPAAAAA